MDEDKLEKLLEFMSVKHDNQPKPHYAVAAKEVCKIILEAVDEGNDSIFEVLSEKCMLTISPYENLSEVVFGFKMFAMALWERKLEKEHNISSDWKEVEEKMLNELYEAMGR